MKLVASVSLIFVALLCLGATHPVEPPNTLVAHEWGTFTSVAGIAGNPVSWAPLFGSGDLPCFVMRTDRVPKALSSGLVRMETPVLYFYSKKDVTLSVQVDFPKGRITEWYPQASKISNSGISWDSVQVLPKMNPAFPTTQSPSHYFAARATDAAPLRIGDQQEKMIFYRGVGDFLPPLWPKYQSDAKLEIRNTGGGIIPLAVLFENHNGSIGYRFLADLGETAQIVDSPEMTGDLGQLRERLAASLEAFGLYRKEALAMVETWRDSWFEEGTRVFYIMPSAQVNPLLPLTIAPAPSEIERVFVGRVELLSPWTETTIKSAMRSGDVDALAKFGRFLNPFLQQIRQHDPGALEAQRTNEYLMNAQNEVQAKSGSCIW